jgi:hypothetical protein
LCRVIAHNAHAPQLSKIKAAAFKPKLTNCA